MPDLEQIPVRKKISKKDFIGYVYIVFNKKGEVLIRKRTEKGILSGLYEFPWAEEKLFIDPVDTKKTVSHVFTHINMLLKICEIHGEFEDKDCFFVAPCNLSKYAFSTLMKKVIKKAGLE